MVKCYREQLAKFREDDETRWKYETAELERQYAAQEKIGRSDDTERKDLEKSRHKCESSRRAIQAMGGKGDESSQRTFSSRTASLNN